MTPSQSPGRKETPFWPLALAGGGGAAAILVLAALQRLAPADALAALLAIISTGALAFVLSGTRGGVEIASAARPPEVKAGGLLYATLIDSLPDPILVVSAGEPDDLTGRRYIFANRAARDLLKLPEREGRLVSAIRDPDVLEAVDQALFGGVDAQTIYETAGAQSRVLRAHARPLGQGTDGRRLALLVLRDETEVRQVERTRSDFLANASHELRTPLASLTGFIETLRGHARDDVTARDRFLAIMQAQAGRMSRLIDDLMSLSRIELNEHIAPEDRVDLAGAMADVIDGLAPLARERGVTLALSAPERGHALVSGDRDQILQVAQNLVDNAMKYSDPGATVEVTVVADISGEAAQQGIRPDAVRMSLLTPDHSGGAYAALRVADAGPGIARENLPRLTERFYRVEGQKSGDRAGTGLGLAIVKHIANRHRGGLTVESAPGQGTVFCVYFPMVTDRPPERTEDRRETVIQLSHGQSIPMARKAGMVQPSPHPDAIAAPRGQVKDVP